MYYCQSLKLRSVATSPAVASSARTNAAAAGAAAGPAVRSAGHGPVAKPSAVESRRKPARGQCDANASDLGHADHSGRRGSVVSTAADADSAVVHQHDLLRTVILPRVRKCIALDSLHASEHASAIVAASPHLSEDHVFFM